MSFQFGTSSIGGIVAGAVELDRRQVLFGDALDMVVEPQAEVQRQPLHRPLILGEDPERLIEVHQVDVWRRVDRDAARHTVEHLQVQIAVDIADVLPIAPLQREAGFEGVAASHVGGRGAIVVDPAVVTESPLLGGIVIEAGRLLDHR